MTEQKIGDYYPTGDGGFRLYVGGERGWILCDDHSELLEELKLIDNTEREGENG